MNILVKTSQHPELVVSCWTPSFPLVVVHLEPIHMVVDDKLTSSYRQGGPSINEEQQDKERSEYVLSGVDDTTQMPIRAFILPLIWGLIHEIQEEMLREQQK